MFNDLSNSTHLKYDRPQHISLPCVFIQSLYKYFKVSHEHNIIIPIVIPFEIMKAVKICDLTFLCVFWAGYIFFFFLRITYVLPISVTDFVWPVSPQVWATLCCLATQIFILIFYLLLLRSDLTIIISFLFRNDNSHF